MPLVHISFHLHCTSFLERESEGLLTTITKHMIFGYLQSTVNKLLPMPVYTSASPKCGEQPQSRQCIARWLHVAVDNFCWCSLRPTLRHVPACLAKYLPRDSGIENTTPSSHSTNVWRCCFTQVSIFKGSVHRSEESGELVSGWKRHPNIAALCDLFQVVWQPTHVRHHHSFFWAGTWSWTPSTFSMPSSMHSTTAYSTWEGYPVKARHSVWFWIYSNQCSAGATYGKCDKPSPTPSFQA